MTLVQVDHRTTVDLLPRQVLILKAIAALWHLRGYAPSIRELQERTAISSSSVILYHIRRLDKLKFLEYTPGAARTIRLTTLGVAVVTESKGAPLA